MKTKTNMKKMMYFQWLCYLLVLVSCDNDWLDAKPDKSLVIPTSQEDFQAMLDNSSAVFNINAPSLGELAADDYYMAPTTFNSMSQFVRNIYLWKQDLFEGVSAIEVGGWTAGYSQIYYANTVIEGVERAETNRNGEAWNHLKGAALFYRAFAYFHLAQVFTVPFNSNLAEISLGLPLRLTTDLNVKIARSTLKDTYDQVISDVIASAGLLPDVPKFKTRPSRPAAYALAARCYLVMGDYEKAHAYSDSALLINAALMDFNSLNKAATLPIARFNQEVIFESSLAYELLLRPGRTNAIIDSTLLSSYTAQDLRKEIFFKRNANGNTYLFAQYSGNPSMLFSGLANDEMYLIRAESAVRTNRQAVALRDLNTLLANRMSGQFKAVEESSAEELLTIILAERRKELCFRGLRWMDLRRLNQDPRFEKLLIRRQESAEYTLPPGDNRYTFPIPPSETLYNTIQQNER